MRFRIVIVNVGRVLVEKFVDAVQCERPAFELIVRKHQLEVPSVVIGIYPAIDRALDNEFVRQFADLLAVDLFSHFVPSAPREPQCVPPRGAIGTIVKSWVNADSLHNSGSIWAIAAPVNGWLATADVRLLPNHQAPAAMNKRQHARIRRLMPGLH
jgi:hypothetical protein